MQDWDFLSEDFEKQYFEDYFTVIVIYDIISNKRRTKLSKILRGFGYRIQRSSFECLLTREKCELLMKKIDNFAKSEDLIRIYRLNQDVKTVIYGEKLGVENEMFYFI
jgi:CRISPR-associated endoribonuclease cas2